ncbi:hypothetical protein [Candidatus Regiella endosymbiont of Tuberolachnus salignus]
MSVGILRDSASTRSQQRGGFKDEGYRHNSGEPPKPTTRQLQRLRVYNF